ncbi:class I SAM-dependent methyltransferase [Flexivirga meconopsidis]|uniref:class I SAM-dependent methyltransferase n=1 Tax=Flexivirga meconopsidis TaxID=2977121 RepID=UPI00223F3C7A|nr:class I SAM-dependent methyltransferase [Flexivirga meconopsidis]
MTTPPSYDPIPSPNIWEHPDTYEIENRGVDPDGLIWAAMRRVRDWAGADVLDIGCGSGYHLPYFARTARRVIGVEPYEPLTRAAQSRVRGLGLAEDLVDVRLGAAQALPVEDDSVDVAHARWSYFFGGGCEPGLAELQRVMRPGGVAFVIDNDASRSRFGEWFRAELPAYDPVGVERFWQRQGFTSTPVTMRWEFDTRADFESVVRIEFTPDHADRILAEHQGTGVDYAVFVRSKTY